MLAEAQRTFANRPAALATLQEAQKLIAALNLETYRLEWLFESAQFHARDNRSQAQQHLQECLEGAQKTGYALLHRQASAWGARFAQSIPQRPA